MNNPTDGLPELVAELRELIGIIRPLAENALQSKTKRRTRSDLEAHAIALAATMDRPNLSKIAKELNVPRSTIRAWRHLRAALSMRAYRSVREPRRGAILGNGIVDGID